MKVLSGLGRFAGAFLLVPTWKFVVLVVWWPRKANLKDLATLAGRVFRTWVAK